MARSFLRYQLGGQYYWGELASSAPHKPDDQVSLVQLGSDFPTTKSLVGALETSEDLPLAASARSIPAKDIASPVTRDANIVCQGLNYFEHSHGDAGFAVRKNNLIFAKASSSLCGPYDEIIKPSIVEMLDYEVEIGLVLRNDLVRGAKITDANIGDFVAGVVLCNDVSARDVMFGATYMQWFQGKSYRTFLPTGPVFYWLEKSEVADVLTTLKITLAWRGQQRQEGVSSQMIFKPAETLTFLAEVMDLDRGDLILTGTPGGVIAKGTPKINAILSEHMLDDANRKPLFVREAHATVSDFMQPGDLMTTNLTDLRSNLDLGGQYSTVVADDK